MTDNVRKVQVELGPRSYDIVIGDGLLSDMGYFLEPVIGKGRVHVVTDETVYDLYKDRLYSLERETGLTVLPAGESQKSFPVLQTVLDNMFNQGLDRGDTLVAFGGGVIGDLTGFAASIYKRGCKFVQVPTTLLSQVDSSVGGKTAINVAQGKNLVGAFYQPSLVLTDSSVLKTLPERELKAGYAEVLKYGLLGDRDFFDWLEIHGDRVLALDADAIGEAIAVSCMMKAAIVAQDEQERGRRALLNLGHTFGHALEAQAGFGANLLHGEAVSAGMQMAFEYSAAQDITTQADVEKLAAHLKAKGLKTISEVKSLTQDTEALLRHMAQDKKNEAGKLTLILARAIGDAYVQKNAPLNKVREYLETLI